MGVVCCTPEISLNGKRMRNRKELCDILNSTNNSSLRDTTLSYENSMRRLTWFSDQYKESGDEEFFTKEINLCDFDIKYMIGKGFYSKVFLVTKIDTNEPYAMKVIKKSQLKNEESKTKIMTEKLIMRMCDSPFIAKLHYAFQTSTKFYFILDFVNGGELQSKLIEKNKFSEELTKFYASEILMALKCLHAHNILYRDLKPKNILVDFEGHIKLIDFGLSKLNWEVKDLK